MRAKHRLLAISIAGLLGLPAVEANQEVLKLSKDPSNWALPLGNYWGTRYSELDQINNKNASKLQPVWTFSTGVLRGHEGGPLVINGVLYVHTPFPNKVYAINLKDQTILWEYEPKQDEDVTVPVMCCDTVNRGLAYGDGKIILQQADTTLTALDAKTGKVVWQVKNGDPKLGQTNTNAPLVVKDKVITGISGGEYGVRGFISAYSLKDGHLIWRAYSMGPDEEMKIDPQKTMTWKGKKKGLQPVGKNSSLKSWCDPEADEPDDGKGWEWNKGGDCLKTTDQWKVGGGTTWGWYTYDPELDLIYYGSGNPGTWNPVQRPGDNKWSMTIWARDPDTGKAKWVFQMTPHDEWDYDGINEMVLANVKIKGKERKILAHFDRNGFAFVLDRETGELIWAEKYNQMVNWAKSFDYSTGRPVVNKAKSTHMNGEDENTEDICPSAMGAKNQGPVAFSPKTGLFYIPGNHICMDYEPFEVEYTPGQPYVGATVRTYASKYDVLTGKPLPKDKRGVMGAFIAWDPATGKIKWAHYEPFSVWSGVLATAGDIVVHGTLEGYLKVRDAWTGKELYRFRTPSGIIGNPNTWMFDGKQYIGVLSGIGGWAGIGMAAGLEEETAGLGAVGAYRSLEQYTKLGGVLTVFALPDSAIK